MFFEVLEGYRVSSKHPRFVKRERERAAIRCLSHEQEPRCKACDAGVAGGRSSANENQGTALVQYWPLDVLLTRGLHSNEACC